MGWTTYPPTHYRRNNRVDVKKEIDAIIERNPDCRLVHSVANGREYYAAVEMTELKTKKRVVVGVVGITRISNEGKMDCEFSYKLLMENEMPFYFKCPNFMLDMLSPTTDNHSLKWRNHCREYNTLLKARHQASAGKLKLKKSRVGTQISCVMFGKQLTLEKQLDQCDRPVWNIITEGVYKEQYIPTTQVPEQYTFLKRV